MQRVTRAVKRTHNPTALCDERSMLSKHTSDELILCHCWYPVPEAACGEKSARPQHSSDGVAELAVTCAVPEHCRRPRPIAWSDTVLHQTKHTDVSQ
jgi:hypothetical protein